MTNNYQNLTIGEILALAQSENTDDNQLASRLARRLSLGEKVFRGVSTQDERTQLSIISRLCDNELDRPNARSSAQSS